MLPFQNRPPLISSSLSPRPLAGRSSTAAVLPSSPASGLPQDLWHGPDSPIGGGGGFRAVCRGSRRRRQQVPSGFLEMLLAERRAASCVRRGEQRAPVPGAPVRRHHARHAARRPPLRLAARRWPLPVPARRWMGMRCATAAGPEPTAGIEVGCRWTCSTAAMASSASVSSTSRTGNGDDLPGKLPPG
jgi:hypothetical protein